MIKVCVKKILKMSGGLKPLDVNLHIDRGELVVLFGGSGAGKTTLLRIIAGLTEPDEGYIEVDGDVWFDSKKQFSLPVQKRRAGFVSQEHSLFPNMTVYENLVYALKERSRTSLVDDWLKIMELEGLSHQRSDKLSGGQKQRIALARALVAHPKILLLDEPLSALDMTLRFKLQDEIIRIHQKTGIATIFVSHELSEVFKLSGKIFVMSEGRIIRSGDPREVFVSGKLSGKFKFAGEIIEIKKDGVVNILTVGIGNNIVKVVATDEEIGDLRAGSKVVVAAKAFNPIISAPGTGEIKGNQEIKTLYGTHRGIER